MGGYRGKKMEGLQLKMPRTKMPAEAQRENDYADCKESASLLWTADFNYVCVWGHNCGL